MNRKLLYLATIILTLAGCTSEDYVGDENLHEANDLGRPVSFNLIAATQTRAVTGIDAAAQLNNNFVVYAWKYFTDESTKQMVFNNYQVNYVSDSQNTTTTNSNGWEYVGYKNLPNGVSGNLGVTAYAVSSYNTSGSEPTQIVIDQSIKYWDFAANQYDFIAYSLGKGDNPTDLTATTYANATPLAKGASDHVYSYSLTGTNAQLAACYVSDVEQRTSLSPSNTSVQLKFRKLESKVKIALYETIPGYSVKEVKFYQSDAATPGTTAYLYSITNFMRNKGTFTVTYDNTTTPTLRWTADGTVADNKYISFGDAVTTSGTTWTHWAGHDYYETDENVYIGRSSNLATGPSDFVSVLPYPDGATLKLKVDYTLVARDGYGETINVKGATATVPAAYAQWKPNCAYTYIFKISDNTDGQVGSETGLYPITLDAIVAQNPDGKQETITTVTAPSITTYQEGSDYAATNEYKAGYIYVVVYDGTGVATLSASNAKLYKASATAADDDHPVNITEESVANAIANTTDAKDANGNALTVTEIVSGSDALDFTDGAKFNAQAGTTYVFEYTYTESNEEKKVYKVIKVARAS